MDVYEAYYGRPENGTFYVTVFYRPGNNVLSYLEIFLDATADGEFDLTEEVPKIILELMDFVIPEPRIRNQSIDTTFRHITRFEYDVMNRSGKLFNGASFIHERHVINKIEARFQRK